MEGNAKEIVKETLFSPISKINLGKLPILEVFPLFFVVLIISQGLNWQK